MRAPQHGSRTHPLSLHALQAIQRLKSGPAPTQSFNPGVVNRLMREDPPIVEEVRLTSPYPSHKRAQIPHLQLTALGRLVPAAP